MQAFTKTTAGEPRVPPLRQRRAILRLRRHRVRHQPQQIPGQLRLLPPRPRVPLTRTVTATELALTPTSRTVGTSASRVLSLSRCCGFPVSIGAWENRLLIITN